jgi:hypothetical protein
MMRNILFIPSYQLMAIGFWLLAVGFLAFNQFSSNPTVQVAFYGMINYVCLSLLLTER